MNIARIVRLLPPPLRRHRLAILLVALSPGSKCQLVEFNHGAQAFADISDPGPRNYMLTGLFEPEFFEIATFFLSGGGTFFDVGANFGFCTFGLIAALAPVQISAHLFEANAYVCEFLRRSAALHAPCDVKVVYCCVTDEPGSSCLKVVPGNLGQSYVWDGGAESVPNLMLDDYMIDCEIERVRFLKMDIEGHEPQALAGMRASLSRGLVDTVYVEVSDENLSRAGSCPEATLSRLRDSGFALFFCKRADFQSGVALKAEPVRLCLDGRQLALSPLGEFPRGLQTDILAIHRSSPFFAAIEPAPSSAGQARADAV